MQAGEQQDASGNILSPEAKEFVPRQINSSDMPENGVVLGQDGVQYGLYDGFTYPGGDGKAGGTHPVGGLPSYMTTCYPFVPSGEQRFGVGRPRGRGKFNAQQMYVQPPFTPTQPGLPRNRFPHPSKGYMQTWNRPPLSDMYGSPFSNLPNGMPFDGGTYQNGFIRPNIPHLPVHDSKPVMSPSQKGVPSVYPTNAGDAPLTNGYADVTNQWNVSGDESSTLNGKPLSNQVRSKNQQDNVGVKTKTSIKSQTDFPDELANATLDDIPNSLFKKPRKFSSSKARHKTHRRDRENSSAIHSDSEDYEADTVHSNSILHRKNQVSNGTNPDAIGAVAMGHGVAMVTHGNQFVLSYKEIVTGNRVGHSADTKLTDVSVPYTSSTPSSVMFSYARVAQSLPSHNIINNNNKSGAPVSMVTNKSDKDSCDSTGRTAKGNSVTAGLNNVNVAQIMKDLETAGTLQRSGCDDVTSRMGTEHGDTNSNNNSQNPIYTWGTGQGHSGIHNPNCYENSYSDTNNGMVISYASKLKQVMSPDVAGHQNSVGHDRSLSVHKVNVSRSQGGQGLSDVGGVVVEGHDGLEHDESVAADNLNETGVKKKRKRRRRRKKKSGDAGAVSDDANSGANDDIMLHFEDEEEFPDLGNSFGGNQQDSSHQAVPFSYSDILKTSGSSSRQVSSGHDTEGVVEEQGSDSMGASGKESRSSRKRRKRREVANKAADAEMAEINLEQHMLELKMKQKHPLSAKKSASPVRKSVSPVRTSPVQSIWKHPPTASPSQPAPSGKKVSLLLPGTVAPDNVSVARQPNPSVKQYSGILKPTQPPSQPTSIGAGSSGGGVKKSKQPITYDLGALIDALEEKKNQPAPLKKDSRPVISRKDEVRSANMLDASAPVKRGKERETPKIKKPSPLKKVILKEREEKKRLRMLDEDDTNSGAPVGIGVVSGESDLSQDASSSKGSMEVGLGTPASAELSPISQPSPSCISPMSPGASPISSGVNSPLTGSTQQFVKLKIHSRRFREYCNQVLDKEIDNCVVSLLTDLVRFQDKQYHKDPIKAKAKRRFVLGLREVTKHLKLKKIKCVIISPNLEKIQSKGGLDDALNNILELCNEKSVPFVFALGRRALGRACAKLVPVSVVGVFNYEGSEENFKSLVNLTEKARDSYKEMIGQIEKEMAEQPPRTHVPGVPHIFAHMGHSRTPSGCSVISFTSSILSEPISENYPYSEPETDNRGYEIEKANSEEAALRAAEKSSLNKSEKSAQDSGKDAFEKDPYEADDESGTCNTNNKKLTSKTANNSANISQHISSSGGAIQSGSGSSSLAGGGSRENLELNLNVGRASNTYRARNDGTQGSDSLQSDSLQVDNVTGEDRELDMLDRLSDNEGDEGIQEVDEDDLDSDDYEDADEDVSDDNEQSCEDCDTIQDLPYIDSVHHFDLHEILSTHSSKTLENGEDVLSTHSSKTTHSSRTPGEGSTILGDQGDKNCKIKIDIKHGETTNSLSLKGKNCLDKETRTLSWVKEAQTLHFNDAIESAGESEENTIDVNNVSLERLDTVA